MQFELESQDIAVFSFDQQEVKEIYLAVGEYLCKEKSPTLKRFYDNLLIAKIRQERKD